MFDEVHASGELRTEVLKMREQRNGKIVRRLGLGGLVAAVLAVVLLAGTALAVTSPTLRDWFAREWGNATGKEISENQALLIEGLTQKVGESAASGDVTVTVDSITVGGDVLWALVDVEGLDFDAGKTYSFDGIYVEILPDPSEGAVGGAGYSLGSIGVTEDGAVRMLLEYSGVFSTGNQINSGGYTLELEMDDLIRCRQGNQEDEVIYAGRWTFSIPLTVESLSPVVTIDSAVVVADEIDGDNFESSGTAPEDGEALEGAPVEMPSVNVTLTDIQISATGVSYRTNDACTLTATAVLKDGSEVCSGSGGGSRLDDGTWYHTHQWPVPIDVEDVVALRLGETEIPVP